jgi:hypothetical protein
MSVIKNVQTDATGVGEISGLTSVSGIGRNFTTLVTVNDTAIVEQLQNNGVNVHQVKGDGRAWFPIISHAPTSPVNGDLWLEQDMTLGTVLRIQTPAGLLTIGASGVIGTGLTYTAASGLLVGMAVYLDPTDGPVYASALVSGAFAYRPRGVVKATAIMGGQVEIITDGEEMQMTDWTLVTGTALLAQGSNYWLTATPGRYSITPGSGVSSRVGYAATPHILVVQTGFNVIGTV